MTRAEFEAQRMAAATGIEWRPIQDKIIDTGFIISCDGQVYNYKLEKHVSPNHDNYIRMRYNGEQYFRQIKELMLNTFPELYPDNPNDVWKTIEIEGEETAYEVNNNGKVRRINNHRELKPNKRYDGYAIYRLRHNHKTIAEYAHRLVATAFLPNPNGYEIINHIDENKLNNNVKNLEWCDKKYNYYYNGAYKRAQSHSVLTQKLQKLSSNGNKAATDILKTPKYYNNTVLLDAAVKLVSE